MKKTFIALTLVSVMIALSLIGFAANISDDNTADALNELGLFLGTGNGYELEKGLTRAQGITLIVRMLGMENTAVNGVYENSFTDLPKWASGYIGYAFENGITKGTSETTFSPETTMTDYMFLTLVMRALNYKDIGENSQFIWNSPYDFAYELELIDSVKADSDFTRADAVNVLWNALDVKLNGSVSTLADRLIEQKVFSADELDDAREIQVNGRNDDDDIAINTPETDERVNEELETEEIETEEIETEELETEPLDSEHESETENVGNPEENEVGRN